MKLRELILQLAVGEIGFTRRREGNSPEFFCLLRVSAPSRESDFGISFMTPETFLDHFATFAAAPNGVAKLRELILQLAVQGQLVPQDPNDEPANELLARIRTELGTQHSDEIKAAIAPTNWASCSIGEIGNIVYGKNLPTTQLKDTGFPVFGANGVIGLYDRYLYEEPQLLISCRGAYSGKINTSPRQAFITNNSLVVELSPSAAPMRDYLFHALAAIDRSSIITGIAQPQVTVANAIHLRIPVPPLAEQKRIVGKVDQLLGQCDELASRQESRRAARERLVVATLDRLTSPWDRLPACRPSLDERLASRVETKPRYAGCQTQGDGQAGSLSHAAAHAQRLQDHFDLLFDTPTIIPHLRQAILQLAIKGQLVPQDPKDEPVSSFLEAVDDARNRLLESRTVRVKGTKDTDSVKQTLSEAPAGWALRAARRTVSFH